ncbi:MAG: cytochrome c [Candidatus Kaistia colombiensis]|nr:MAG: cytochrome c [Kaistia sp.]
MRLKIMLAGLGLALALGTAGLAHAADDVIAERQALMKANAAAAKTIFDMIQGKAPYDEATARLAFEKLAGDLKAAVALFPDGSDQGKTSASPAIWNDKTGFEAIAAKLVTDATAGAAAADGGLDAIKASAMAVGGSCQSCHEKFRIKKP